MMKKCLKLAALLSVILGLTACQGQSPLSPSSTDGVSTSSPALSSTASVEPGVSSALGDRSKRSGGRESDRGDDRDRGDKRDRDDKGDRGDRDDDGDRDRDDDGDRDGDDDGDRDGDGDHDGDGDGDHDGDDDGDHDDDDDEGDDDGGIIPPPPPPSTLAATARLTASPTSIQAGGTTTLTWTTANATTATLDNVAVALTGSRVVTPSATTTYTLVATGANGSATSRATVTVTAVPPPPPPPPPPVPVTTAQLTANPVSIQAGSTTTLTWTTTNATTAMLDDVVVALSGSRVVAPSATTAYTLVATGASGSATSRVTVTVAAVPPPPPPPMPTAWISATPASIESGASSTLSWSTTNATTVTLDGATVAATGSRVVSPSGSHTYNLVATNASGSQLASATVTVTPPPPPPPPTPVYTYTNDIAPVLAAQCTFCHNPGNSRAGIDLSTYQAIQPLVASHTTSAILPRSILPGGAMDNYVSPYGSMSAAQVVDMITEWVLSGAPQ